jgi:hypothetical protein
MRAFNGRETERFVLRTVQYNLAQSTHRPITKLAADYDQALAHA